MSPTVNRLILFVVACANIGNVILMRNSELASGIEVYDKEGTIIGTSKVAAKSVSTVPTP